MKQHVLNTANLLQYFNLGKIVKKLKEQSKKLETIEYFNLAEKLSFIIINII